MPVDYIKKTITLDVPWAEIIFFYGEREAILKRLPEPEEDIFQRIAWHGVYVVKEHRYNYILVNSGYIRKTKRLMDISEYITHESVHCARSIMEFYGIQDEEYEAYLVSFLASDLIDFVWRKWKS